jgi:hypothetical protein
MTKSEYNPITVYYSLWGEEFYPSKLHLDGDIEIVDSNDPEEIGDIGKYRDKPLPYGACKVECTLNNTNNIIYMAKHLKNHHNLLMEANASDIVYWIIWRGIQGNMEFDVNELSALAEMKIPVAMDYIQIED